MRLFVIIMTLMVVSATPAWAGREPAQLNDDETGLVYKQTASKILVAVQSGPDITLIFTALPQIALCGRVSDLPVKVDYNNEEVNIRFKDYTFTHPVGQDQPNCGPSVKNASARVLLDRARLNEYSVKNIRLFYQGWVESYRLNRTGDTFEVTPPDKVKFFMPDERAAKALEQAVTAPQTVAPAPATTTLASNPVAAAPKNNLLVLTTGDTAQDQKLAGEIAKLAISRGLVATDQPTIFSDVGGQFYFQLGFHADVVIGAIMADGTRWPVVARRAP